MPPNCVAAGSRISEYLGCCEILLVSGHHRRKGLLQCVSVGGSPPLARIFFLNQLKIGTFTEPFFSKFCVYFKDFGGLVSAMQKPRVGATSRFSEYLGRCKKNFVSGHRCKAPLRRVVVGRFARGISPLHRFFF